MASQPPLTTPWSCKASMAYAEQVGVNLQLAGVQADIPT